MQFLLCTVNHHPLLTGNKANYFNFNLMFVKKKNSSFFIYLKILKSIYLYTLLYLIFFELLAPVKNFVLSVYLPEQI